MVWSAGTWDCAGIGGLVGGLREYLGFPVSRLGTAPEWVAHPSWVLTRSVATRHPLEGGGSEQTNGVGSGPLGSS
jgi:hypothetical protein